ncbi:hypothetical protein BJX61DRAFT_528446 [Aspergillus egyptiacus]|nr:hypothetical protein BJX61DRAFT_528446 [Aspergillus egyptiacus]
MGQKKNNYTDPELREQVKEEIQQGDKGGKPGQWSARKAQMTASEYKARGGDYTTSKDEKQSQQKNLDKWTEEEWQTKEGSGTAKQDDGTRKRYLPKKAWEEMTEEEKQQTEERKMEGSKEGKQFVGNTAAAKRKRKEANEKHEEGKEDDEKHGDEDQDEDEKDGGEDDRGETDEDIEDEDEGEGESEIDPKGEDSNNQEIDTEEEQKTTPDDKPPARKQRKRTR